MNAKQYTLTTALFISLVMGLSIRLRAQTPMLEEPNFLVFLTDDQGWAGTSVPMDATVDKAYSPFYETPNFDKLAENGLRFSRAYSAAPKCTPSRAGLLSGQSPARLRFTENGGGIGQAAFSKEYNGTALCPDGNEELITSALTIGEWFHENRPEYTTAHIGKWHVGVTGNGPGERGFDVHDGPTANGGGNPNKWGPDNPKQIISLSEKAVGFMMDQVDSLKPFYLQISHYAVHEPNHALEATIAKVTARTDNPPGMNTVYTAMTQDLDSGLGIVIDAMVDLGLMENTYIFYVSDNGALQQHLANGPLANGKSTNWEGGIRTPMVITGPGVVSNGISDVRVTGIDIFPTIVSLLDMSDKIPGEVDGGSLVDVMFNPLTGTVKRRHEGLFFHIGRYRSAGSGIIPPSSALLLDDYKILREIDTKAGGYLMHLYNLKEDISETNNLADSMPEMVKDMDSRLQAYLEDVGAEICTPNPDYTGPNPYVAVEPMDSLEFGMGNVPWNLAPGTTIEFKIPGGSAPWGWGVIAIPQSKHIYSITLTNLKGSIIQTIIPIKTGPGTFSAVIANTGRSISRGLHVVSIKTDTGFFHRKIIMDK